MNVLKTSELRTWYEGLHLRAQAQVDARITRIEKFDHFGNWKYLGDGLAELKWKSGLRVYFSRVGNKIILLIQGGTKHGQKKDIKKAKKILQEYADISP